MVDLIDHHIEQFLLNLRKMLIKFVFLFESRENRRKKRIVHLIIDLNGQANRIGDQTGIDSIR